MLAYMASISPDAMTEPDFPRVSCIIEQGSGGLVVVASRFGSSLPCRRPAGSAAAALVALPLGFGGMNFTWYIAPQPVQVRRPHIRSIRSFWSLRGTGRSGSPFAAPGHPVERLRLGIVRGNPSRMYPFPQSGSRVAP